MSNYINYTLYKDEVKKILSQPRPYNPTSDFADLILSVQPLARDANHNIFYYDNGVY